jgi:glycerol-3-phosphate dehydrogenase
MRKWPDMTRAPELSFRTRVKNLDRLANEAFDLCIIGGGITGAGVARDACLRGLTVALVEREDFATGTSSRSSKLIHGGLRYLQQGDVGLVREAATERYAVRKIAPHLARPRQMLVPLYSRGGYAKIRVGLWTYDRLAQVSDEERHRMLAREETLALEPALKPDGLYGAGLYYEYLTDDARLVTEVIKSAASLGAVVANYAEVTGCLIEQDRVRGVYVRDRLTGGELTVRAKVTINAAGPWVDLVRLMGEPGDTPRLRLTKGIHVSVRSERLGLSRIVVMNARDHRGVFAVPHGPVTYLGTTDTDHGGEPEVNPRITLDDVEYLLEAAARTFVGDPVTPADVVGAWAGLRPLLHQEGKSASELSRKDEIMVGRTGLLSIAGGKLTTFRRMAERVVDLACERLQETGQTLPARVGESAEVELSGGATGDDVDAYGARLKGRWPRVGSDIVDRLVRVYGSNAERMVEAMSADPALAERCGPEAAVTRAEVEYAVREEMALTLNDFLERRARLFLWEPDNGLGVAEGVARTMAAILRWTPARIDDEISAYRAHVEQVKSFQQAAEFPAEAVQAVHA